MTHPLRTFCMLLGRDISLAWRNRMDIVIGLVFFAVVVTIFPLAMDPHPELLRQVGVAVIMVSGLLANLLTLPSMFEDDLRDGSLVQLWLLPLPKVMLVWAKMITHWLTIGLPLTLIAPLLALQYQLGTGSIVSLTLSLLMMMPVLSAIGALGAALTLGLARSGVLLALIHLPLCVPVVVFACQAADPTSGSVAEWWLLGALLLSSWFFSPLAAASALRLAVE